MRRKDISKAHAVERCPLQSCDNRELEEVNGVISKEVEDPFTFEIVLLIKIVTIIF